MEKGSYLCEGLKFETRNNVVSKLLKISRMVSSRRCVAVAKISRRRMAGEGRLVFRECRLIMEDEYLEGDFF